MSQHTQIKTAQAQPPATPQFASILIVDDQRFDRARLKKLCRKFDFTTHVLEADSLADMRVKLTKERFDLVLLDYHLTDGTGLDGIEMIQADEVNRTAALLMITGTEENDMAIKALKSGFTDYLTKDDLSHEGLARAVITALQKSTTARGEAPTGARQSLLNGTLQSFSRECAQDIKPIVSRMMRQMRELREIEKLDPEDAVTRIERVEGSLRRLWSFLDDLDHLGGAARTGEGPTVPQRSVDPTALTAKINFRVPSQRPKSRQSKPAKPPSIFRRRPD
ncbi:MAG: response regulator [Sulfitobacter sp.]